MSYARNYRKSKFNTFTKIWSLLCLIALLVFVPSMLVLDVVAATAWAFATSDNKCGILRAAIQR